MLSTVRMASGWTFYQAICAVNLGTTTISMVFDHWRTLTLVAHICAWMITSGRRPTLMVAGILSDCSLDLTSATRPSICTVTSRPFFKHRAPWGSRAALQDNAYYKNTKGKGGGALTAVNRLVSCTW